MDIANFAAPLSSSTTLYGLTLLTVVLGWLFYKSTKQDKDSSLRYPPGPPRWIPLLGSLASMPKHKPWDTYEKWGKEYNSDILHLQGSKLSIIILNSKEVATDLLVKRSSIYSSRGDSAVINMMGWQYLMSNMPYNNDWRSRRKLFQKYFHPTKPEVFQPKILTAIRERLIPGILETPSEWSQIFRQTIGAAAISIAYGIPFDTNPTAHEKHADDNAQWTLESMTSLAAAAVESLNAAFASGAVAIDFIGPVMMYLPSWCPGMGFKSHLSRWQKLAKDFREVPFSEGQKLIREGRAEESFISLCLDDDNKELDVIKDTAALMFAGGVDTILALIHNFVLAMLLHPSIQAKAQLELDQLLISEKRQIPEYNDQDKLPYLCAVLKELHRWRPVLPIGPPHSLIQPDIYKGYHIPKDSFIFPNVWLMLHDERSYGPDTDKFNPERFLNPDGKTLKSDIDDPVDVAFGFGRRICPGMHIAQSEMFIIAAHILATFTIEPIIDENGKFKEPPLDWPDLIVCPPLPFDCEFVPRSVCDHT